MRAASWAFLLLAAPLSAQQAWKPPALMVQPDQDQPSRPIDLKAVHLDVSIVGQTARTALTMTFANSLDRALEGNLYFPLPQGSSVSGYALDVNGQMVDAVAVERQKARQIFEYEQRKGIDPGLVEWTKGNNFQTRVHPIPARGQRTVRVEYLSELSAGKAPGTVEFHFPLSSFGKLAQFGVRLSVDDAEAKAAAPAWIKIEKTPRGLAWTGAMTDAKPSGDLELTIPVRTTHIAVGKDQKGRETYFAVRCTPPVPKLETSLTKGGALAVYWDASLSRAGSDLAREFDLLSQAIRRFEFERIELTAFRDQPEAVKTFMVDKDPGKSIAALIEHLRKLPYDGATQLGALSMVKTAGKPRFALLFTDGLNNLGAEVPKTIDLPVYTVASDLRANHPLLTDLAARSGGVYFNLTSMAPQAAVNEIDAPLFQFLRADYDSRHVDDVCPNSKVPVRGRFTVVGRLKAPSAEVTLHFGVKGVSSVQVKVLLRRSDAETEAGGGLVARLWAQEKVESLLANPERNYQDLLRVGRQFGMATPATSLLVLETIEQYLQHGVEPPRNRKQIYDEWTQRIEQRKIQTGKTREEKLLAVAAQWNERVKWWGTDYKPPVGFVYRGDGGKGGAPALVGGVTDAMTVDRPAASAPETPPSRGAMPPAGGPRPAEPQLREHRRQTTAAKSDARDEGGAGVNRLSQMGRPARAGEAMAESGSARGDREPGMAMGGAGGGLGGGGGRFAVGGGLGGAPSARAAAAGPSSQPTSAVQLRSAGRQTQSNGRNLGLSSLAAAAKPDLAELVDGSGVALKAWDPQTPYLSAMVKAGPQAAYAVYLDFRFQFSKSPAFYIDCAEYFLRNGQRDLGVRVLTNVVELQLEDARLMRIVAHRLQQIGNFDLAVDLFEKVRAARPEEPQSLRDLALALGERADHVRKSTGGSNPSVLADYRRAIGLLNDVVLGTWDGRFPQIETIAIAEANGLVARQASLEAHDEWRSPLDGRLQKLLDVDVWIAMTWDTDLTDIDLWVTEPTGEKCDYSHNRTVLGGLLTNDFTQGYGPEVYMLRKTRAGKYKIQCNFYGTREQALTGGTTVQATVITNFGRPNEERKSLTLRLTTKQQIVDIGEIALGAASSR